MVGLFFKHLLFDFFLQPPYQYKNKGTYLHMGGIFHAGLHVIGTVLVLFLCGIVNLPVWIALAVVGSEFLIHYHMDYFKVRICKAKNYLPTNSEKYWWWLGFDQFVHQMNYVLIIYLVWGYL